MCDCCLCNKPLIVLDEISNEIKPCLSLTNQSDAANLLLALQTVSILSNAGAPFVINGCEASVVCGSIQDIIRWRRNNASAPTSDLAQIVNLLIPSLENFSA